MEDEKLVAKVELYNEHERGVKQRKQIAKWLRQKAKDVEKEGDQYSTRFKAALYWAK